MVQYMKTVLVIHAKKMDDTPPLMYTNEAVSSYKYYKKHYDTYMGFMIYNITFKTLAYVNLIPFKIYKNL